MKFSKCLFLGVLFFVPVLLSAQSITGSWIMEGTTPDGVKVANKVSFGEDGVFTVDFGMDGSIDVNGTFTVDGGKISLSDSMEESPCYGKVGVYTFVVAGDEVTVQLVEDPCDARRGDGKPMTMKRAK